MKSLVYAVALAALTAVTLSGCASLGKLSPNATTDVAAGVACLGEVQVAAPACIAEVPSCVALGKVVSGKK